MDYAKAVKYFQTQTNKKKRGGYTEIKMAAKSEDRQDSSDSKPDKAYALVKRDVEPSKLSSQVQTLIKFFFDKALMESSIVSVNVDVRKMPLGQLSKETVLIGYQILR